LPDELARSFDNMVDLLAPGAVMVITIKLSHVLCFRWRFLFFLDFVP
jgi:hypothetical protein